MELVVWIAESDNGIAVELDDGDDVKSVSFCKKTKHPNGVRYPNLHNATVSTTLYT